MKLEIMRFLILLSALVSTAFGAACSTITCTGGTIASNAGTPGGSAATLTAPTDAGQALAFCCKVGDGKVLSSAGVESALTAPTNGGTATLRAYDCAATFKGNGFAQVRTDWDKCQAVAAAVSPDTSIAAPTAVEDYRTGGTWTPVAATATTVNAGTGVPTADSGNSAGCVAQGTVAAECKTEEQALHKTCVANVVTAKAWSRVSHGTATATTQDLTTSDPARQPNNHCAKCALGYFATTNKCGACAETAGTTTWLSTQTDDDNRCIASACNAGFVITGASAAVALCAACSNALNGGAAYTKFSAADGTTDVTVVAGIQTAAHACKITGCVNSRFWYDKAANPMDACESCAQISGGWTVDQTGGTNNGVITGETGYATLVAGTTKSNCKVTCSDGYYPDATAATTCTVCTTVANTANYTEIVGSCTWTCAEGYYADGGPATAPTTCTLAVAKRTYTNDAATSDVSAAAAIGITTTFPALTCTTTGKRVEGAVFATWWRAAGSTSAVVDTRKTATTTKAEHDALVAAGATRINIGSCVAHTMTAYEFVKNNQSYVCGACRTAGSGAHKNSLTANPTTTPAYDDDNPTVCAPAVSSAWGSVNRLRGSVEGSCTGAGACDNPDYDISKRICMRNSQGTATDLEACAWTEGKRDWHLTASGTTFDDAAVTECNFQSWNFEQTMVDVTNTDAVLDGASTGTGADKAIYTGYDLATGAACNLQAADTPVGCSTNDSTTTPATTDNVPVFVGKCSDQRSYYLTWSTAQCGAKANLWVRYAGSDMATCNAWATAWVTARANAHGKSTTQTFAGWSKSTTLASRCPATNTDGGFCSETNISGTGNYDKRSLLSNEYGIVATVEQCQGVAVGTGSSTNFVGGGATAAAILTGKSDECEAYWGSLETPLKNECARQGANWATVTAFEATLTATEVALFAGNKVYELLGDGNWSKVVTVSKQTTTTPAPAVTTYDFADPLEVTGTNAVAARWNQSQYTSRDVVPAFASLAWYAKQVKSVTKIKAGFKAATCTAVSPATTPATYTCTDEQNTWLETVSAGVCTAAGRVYANSSCDDASQPGTTPGTTSGTSTSPASVVYSFFALLLAVAFAF